MMNGGVLLYLCVIKAISNYRIIKHTVKNLKLCVENSTRIQSEINLFYPNHTKFVFKVCVHVNYIKPNCLMSQTRDTDSVK